MIHDCVGIHAPPARLMRIEGEAIRGENESAAHAARPRPVHGHPHPPRPTGAPSNAVEGVAMKRIGLFLLAVVMVAGLAGCSSGGDDEIDVTGTWNVTAIWTGYTESGTFAVYPDGTAVAGPWRAPWSLNVNTITIVIPAQGPIRWPATYVGTVDNDGLP